MNVFSIITFIVIISLIFIIPYLIWKNRKKFYSIFLFIFYIIFLFFCFKLPTITEVTPEMNKNYTESNLKELLEILNERKNVLTHKIVKEYNYKDAWDNYFLYDTEENIIFSCGPDEKPYTNDDIKKFWNNNKHSTKKE